MPCRIRCQDARICDARNNPGCTGNLKLDPHGRFLLQLGRVLGFGPVVSGFFEAFEVIRPQGVMILAEAIECFPGKDTRVVVVIKIELHGIVTNGFDLIDVHVLFADL